MSDQVCTICLNTEEGAWARPLPCGHTFHQSCLTKWDKMDTNKCPNCRQPRDPDHETKGLGIQHWGDRTLGIEVPGPSILVFSHPIGGIMPRAPDVGVGRTISAFQALRTGLPLRNFEVPRVFEEHSPAWHHFSRFRNSFFGMAPPTRSASNLSIFNRMREFEGLQWRMAIANMTNMFGDLLHFDREQKEQLAGAARFASILLAQSQRRKGFATTGARLLLKASCA